MAKVKMNPTPSEQLISHANEEVEVTSPRGRRILLRQPGPLAQFDLIEALGSETAQNSVFMHMAFPLLFIGKLDGEMMSRVRTRLQFDALVTKVGADWDFVAEEVMRQYNGTEAEAEATLKN